MGRNLIKNLQGIEAVSDTLEQLWISYNQIDKLKPIRNLSKLKILYMAHNLVREWREFDHLMELHDLEDLVFIGNPLEEEATMNGNYTQMVSKRLLALMKLDGFPIIREEEGEEEDGDVDDSDSDDSEVEVEGETTTGREHGETNSRNSAEQN